MTLGVVMIVIGSVVYLATPAIGVARRGPNAAPGGHDVPVWVTTVALLGGLIALLGVVVVVFSVFGVI